ncbi:MULTISPECIES: tyrosine-type recombinase/integrase [Rhodococcus]|uniref:Tyrosine-type recombinase/integrase n=1 Tax=Rhodococcus oxybenzonivorans TaxID=1990687 RepID=A0AAE5A5B0_9NOCA|nr:MULTISPECIES: tyrosine-type recombinase/integrase [Rhodococcus]MDV7245503.1 tyrosine-type recombinase/integrase [Rhodococcus oxybenzonivorans]MDV7263304.1 tyrosine-type recombinase/integrase [Rhodococcus oxybenzonivorans]MDV7276583.1 tyrosine-type recombinase/integrase [Rhodococcus oxybenzonivorans]MDV7336490.1 tyrosine-type recombinase/integrase [Rhodococcus oxybenzonivorans]MDV7346821.1 tyrosine-type recombinase/integrase [Rhodococcus oxybenzonivorans]
MNEKGTKMAGRKGRRSWGRIRKLPSGRYQAGYVALDGTSWNALTTYTTKLGAEAWLADERRLLESGAWTPPPERAAARTGRALTVAAYVERWLDQSASRLKASTMDGYRRYGQLIVEGLGPVALATLSPSQVRQWLADLDPKYPTRNAGAYSLLRTVMNTAVEDGLIPANPCRVRGGATKHRKHEPVTLSPSDIRAVARSVPVERWRALVLLLGFSGLRFGEARALRRRDLTLTDAECSVHVRRATVRAGKGFITDRPKTPAALRTVPLPHELRRVLEDHIAEYAEAGADGLVFPAPGGGHAHRQPFANALRKGAESVGFPTLRVHDLRHSALTNWGRAGATLADLLALGGHTTAALTARYTHAAPERNAALAAKLWAE